MSPLAPILGQRLPLRGPARLLFRSYAKTPCLPGVALRRLTSRLGDDFDVDLSSFPQWQLWAFGSHQEHFAELFSCLVEPGDRCIDVGANVGVHTVRLAKLAGPQGEVIAIEPNEEAARRAASNLALNQVTNARVMNAAATGQAGAKVPTVSIDDICPGPVALIKIDAEGHEAAVVTGAAATIDRYSPNIIFGYTPYLPASPARGPFAGLAGRGYELLSVQRERNALTGRGRLTLRRLQNLPGEACDILAIPPSQLPRLEFPARQAPLAR
jgi:hypothetical protein